METVTVFLPDIVEVFLIELFWSGNPIGGLVFSSAFGQLEQIHEWTVG